MKLVTYTEPETPSKTRPGLLWGNWILGIHEIPRIANQLNISVSKRLARVCDKASSTLDLVASGKNPLDDLQALSWRIFNRIDPKNVSRTLKKAKDVRMHAPIPRPPIIRDFYAFEDHVRAARARRGLPMPKEWYDFPAFYYSNPSMVYGPDEDVPYPFYTKALDYELEIACILGRDGINMSQEEAGQSIAGYTIMNDWSARDVQEREMKIGLGPAKAKDFATSLGPWLVTPDELEDTKTSNGEFDLQMKARVNGKLLSKGNTKNMHWTFHQMIARASESAQLHAGEVFGSGTVGSGSLLELGQKVHPYLKPGDRVELEIDRLGALRNRIIQSPKS